MKIIDTHMHHGVNSLFYMPDKMVIKTINKYHLMSAIVSNCRGGEFDHDRNRFDDSLQTPQIKVLKESIKFARKNKGKFYIAPWIKPYSETCDDEFFKLVEDNIDIIKAIKIHPFSNNVAPDDERMEPYYALAEKYHLVILSHCGGGGEASPERLLNAAKKHPHLNFVMVHLDLGSDHVNAIECLGKAKNLYGDTTWVDMETTLEVIKRYGSEKIMFGSDAPIDGVDTYKYFQDGSRSLYQDYFYEIKKRLSQEDYDNLMYKNAKRLFGI